MREVPISCGFLPFPAIGGSGVALAKLSCYFVSVVNAPCALVILRRDMNATRRSLSIVCRERGWSKARAVYELQNGLPYQTVPPLPQGYSIDWRDPDVTYGLNVETGDLTLILGVFGGPGLGLDTLTVSIEVLPPAEAEAPAPPAAQLPPHASAQWAAATVRDLLREGKLPDEAKKTKAALARFLEAEAQKAVTAGKLRRALQASYLEDQLIGWGIWPLSSRK